MKTKFIFVFAVIIMGAPGLKAQDSSEIIFASSFYQTASGAIGPQHITATTTYRIKIKNVEELKIDSIIVGHKKIICKGITIPKQDDTIDFTIVIATHQNKSIWYTSRVIVNDTTTYSYEAQLLNKDNSAKANPAVVVYGQKGHSSYKLVKDKFDQKHSQYNK